MALLDLQGMNWTADENRGGHGGGDSDLSVTTCNAGGSSLSLLLCDVD
jgi:hypothetical protein